MHIISRNWHTAARLAALALLIAPIIAACASNHSSVKRGAFSSREFGVAVSPRVTKSKNPPHGGGRYLAGRSYVVRGVTYRPVDGPGYVARGEASWYGWDFHGRRTANGEIFGANYLTAASPVLPVPCYARVTNLENGRSVMVRINDRGPYMQGRIIDVSLKTAEVLGFANGGSANVQVAYVSPAPLNGDDTRMLMASVNRPSPIEQGDTRFAMLDTPSGNHGSSSSSHPSSRDPLSGGMLGAITGLFSYAYADAETENQAVLDAHDAVNAMATRAGALDDWVASVDDDKRAIKLQLGVFDNHAHAIDIAVAFAMLGAVDEDDVMAGDHVATRLTLSHLKPGVARSDVLELARELGLTNIVLY